MTKEKWSSIAWTTEHDGRRGYHSQIVPSELLYTRAYEILRDTTADRVEVWEGFRTPSEIVIRDGEYREWLANFGKA